MIDKNEANKQFAQFSQTNLYQLYLKPYLLALVETELTKMDIEIKSGFDSIKRDITLQAVRGTINKIINKIEKAADNVDLSLKTGVQVNIKKYEEN